MTSTLGVPDSAVRAWITEMDPHGFIRAGEIAADQLARANAKTALVLGHSQSSISLRAIDSRPGRSGRLSRVNQRASTSSASSMRRSPLTQVAVKPIMSECGNGQGWLAK